MNTINKLAIIARLHLQLQQANLIQTLQMAEAFGDLVETVLISDKSRKDFMPGSKKLHDIIYDFGFKLNFEFLHYNNLYYFLPKTEPLRKKYLLNRALKYVKNNNIDYIFTREEEVAYCFCKILPTIFELHDINYINNFEKLLSLTNAGKLKILSISYRLKDILIAKGINVNNVFVYHDCVNLERFQNKSIKPLFKKRNQIIGYSGHLYKDRGVELIIKLAKSNPAFEFYIAGGLKKDVNHYKTKVRKSDISNITFLGMLPYKKIPEFLKTCDVLIMPYSKSLNTIDSCSPLKVFEYMASGKIIITSNIPTILEVLNENNALIFEADSFDSLQKALNKIKNNSVDKESLLKNMLENIKKYSWKKRSEYVLDKFREF